MLLKKEQKKGGQSAAIPLNESACCYQNGIEIRRENGACAGPWRAVFRGRRKGRRAGLKCAYALWLYALMAIKARDVFAKGFPCSEMWDGVLH